MKLANYKKQLLAPSLNFAGTDDDPKDAGKQLHPDHVKELKRLQGEVNRHVFMKGTVREGVTARAKAKEKQA